MIQVWINFDDADNATALIAQLEKALSADATLHGFVIVTDESRKPELQKWAAEVKPEKTALTYLSVGVKGKVSNDYRIGEARNVVIVSRNKTALASFEDLSAAEFSKAIAALNAVK